MLPAVQEKVDHSTKEVFIWREDVESFRQRYVAVSVVAKRVGMSKRRLVAALRKRNAPFLVVWSEQRGYNRSIFAPGFCRVDRDAVEPVGGTTLAAESRYSLSG